MFAQCSKNKIGSNSGATSAVIWMIPSEISSVNNMPLQIRVITAVN